MRSIISKYITAETVVNLPWSRPANISPRVQQQLIQEVTKDPRRTFKGLQAYLASEKGSVLDSTIKKRLDKDGVRRSVARHRPLLTNRNINVCLTFVKKKKKNTWVTPKRFGKMFYGQMSLWIMSPNTAV